jgi:hypothetical protein
VKTDTGPVRFWPIDWDRACALAGVNANAMAAKLVAFER